MNVHELIERAGTVGKLARRLGVAHNTVSDWKRSGFIPGSRLAQARREFDLTAEETLGLAQRDEPARAA